MSHFLALPLEIRVMIYKYCLVVGKVFPYTLSEHHYMYISKTRQAASGCDVPEVAILRACRTIYQEAEPILYQENVFALPNGALTGKFFEVSLNTDARRAWVTSVEIRLDPLDLTKKEREMVRDDPSLRCSEDWLYPRGRDNSNFTDFINNTHDGYAKNLRNIVWPRMVAPLLNFLRLEKLVLDVYSFHCIRGCCNGIDEAMQALSNGFVLGAPKELEIRGDGADEWHERLTAAWTLREKEHSDNVHTSTSKLDGPSDEGGTQ